MYKPGSVVSFGCCGLDVVLSQRLLGGPHTGVEGAGAPVPPLPPASVGNASSLAPCHL